MYSRTLLAAVSTLLAASTSFATEFELKGLRIGMDEKALLAAHSSAKCSNGIRAKEAPPTLSKLRVCHLPGMTLANEKMDEARALFYDGQLGFIDATMPPHAHAALDEAMGVKFGKPTPGHRPGSNTWQVGTARVFLTPMGTDRSGLLMVSSPVSDAYDRQLADLKRKRGASDL